MARNTPKTHSARPIGRVHSPLRKPADAPKHGFEGTPEAWVRIDPRLLEAIDGTPIIDIKPALAQAAGW